jgi:hypothetical protein
MVKGPLAREGAKRNSTDGGKRDEMGCDYCLAKPDFYPSQPYSRISFNTLKINYRR